jgi:triosephosphate isomerase
VSVAGTGGDRVPLIAGNWKMHKTIAEAETFVAGLLPRVSTASGVDVAICPTFTALGPVVDSTRGSRVQVFAQNMHHEHEGAFTGEVSPPMLNELGVHGVILGHSERRENGDTERKLRHQVQEDLARVETERLGAVVIAYEPIWAIGTGRVATPEQAQDAIGFVRALVADRSPEQALRTRVLYGGSVSPESCPSILSLPDVDGALVGGASLSVESFAAIVAAAG